ncbi:MAG TPA: MCP four helix bundle domain-containing protein, partial [Gallionella sp.]|nr:MCP four helix bundle domain-containing protein [Gallionella sp.]
MFKNMKIGARLGLGFGLVLVLLSMIAFVGITRLGGLNNDVDNMANDKYPKTVLANNLIDAMNTVARVNRNTLLTDDPAELDKQRAIRDEARKQIGEIMQKLEDTVKSEAGIKKVEAIKEARTAYVTVLDKFIETNKSGDRKGAIAMLFGEFSPVTAAYLKSINDLIDFQDELMKKSGEEANQSYLEARNMMITM